MTQLVLAVKLVTLVFAALVAILNPPASVPIFLASTTGCSTDMRKALAWRIALNVFIILTRPVSYTHLTLPTIYSV